MTPDAPCPRCGKHPAEVHAFGLATPRYIPACSCYPHPPSCVCCHQALTDDRCATTTCPVFDVLQPAPLVDPLWAEVTGEDERSIVAPSPGFERLAEVMGWPA